MPFLCALLSIFQSPGVISGEVDTVSSSLSAFACASYGASLVASSEFPYLPIASTTDSLAMPAVIVGTDYVVEGNISSYYDQQFTFQQSDMTSCYDTDGSISSVDVHACRNSSFMSGTFLFDPGCQTTLMKTSFNRFMKSVRDSNLRVSGFDNSTQLADKNGTASMYFLQIDNEFQPSTDQGVDNFKFDTVDELQTNLFSVSDYYKLVWC